MSRQSSSELSWETLMFCPSVIIFGCFAFEALLDAEDFVVVISLSSGVFISELAIDGAARKGF